MYSPQAEGEASREVPDGIPGDPLASQSFPVIKPAETGGNAPDSADKKAPGASNSGEAGEGKTQATESPIVTYDASNLPDRETVLAIVDLFTRMYGDVRNRPIFKDPERYIEEVRAGRLVSFVGRGEGKVMAHAALVDQGDRVMELDLGLIDPAYRGHKVGNAVWDMSIAVLEGLARKGEVDVMRADCVTSHTITQKYAFQHGSKVTGLFDRKYCDFFKTDRPESVVRLDLIFNPAIKEQREVFITPTLRTLAEGVYEHSACQRRVTGEYPADYRDPGNPSVARADYEMQAFQARTLKVSPGVTPYQLTKETEQALASGVKHLSVQLDITHPSALDQINCLRALGFYFAALEMKREKDYLVMQRYNSPTEPMCCPHDIKLHHEDARTMLSLIRTSQLS